MQNTNLFDTLKADNTVKFSIDSSKGVLHVKWEGVIEIGETLTKDGAPIKRGELVEISKNITSEADYAAIARYLSESSTMLLERGEKEKQAREEETANKQSQESPAPQNAVTHA